MKRKKEQIASAIQNMEDRLYSSRETAEYLGISMRTLAAYRKEKKGPKYACVSYRKRGYRKSDIDRYIEELTVASTSDPKFLAILKNKKTKKAEELTPRKTKRGRPRTLPPAGNLPQQVTGQELVQQPVHP
ncbi:helix-turn-helix domain protein [Caedimonas varicaedens]|uniref:Helix-turn-helix domain protein n=1 Tax=Caedimonas varicaedens TaxID=1629334 RepID=A0A0K8MEV5_9PROT|nr:helix-turn-helix domain protein [Caedimonas varicaedens]